MSASRLLNCCLGSVPLGAHPRPCARASRLVFVLLLLFALRIAGPAAAAVTYVQSSSQSGGAVRTSSTANFAAPQTVGNLNVVFIGWQGAAADLISIVDSVGNTYTRALSTSYGSTATQVVYYAGNIVGAPAGGNTITATFAAKVANPDLRIIEYSGVASTRPLDVFGGLATAGALTSSGAVTTLNASDMLVASNFSQQSVTAAGTGYTLRLKDQYSQIVEDAIVTATGKYTATAPQTKSGWFVMQLVAFRAATASSSVVVPSVVGQNQAVATGALTGLGLVPGRTIQQTSVTVPAGSVISESPIAGTSVPVGSTVNLVISSGPASVSILVPSIVGAPQAAASAAITRVGLAVGTVTQQTSSTVAIGNVLSQLPGVGASVAPGSAVNFVVSVGYPVVTAPPVIVPNVVGATQAAATSAVTARGLVVGALTRQTSTTVAAGIVISELPTAGTSTASGSAVNLWISSGAASFGVSPYPASSILASISWDETSKQRYAAGSDIWDSMWASDGLVYGAWGDGNGFSAPAKKQIGVSRLTGSPASGPLVGADVYLGSPSPRVSPCGQKATIGGKPHGVIALPNAVMYMFHSTYDLCTSSSTLARSLNNGVTWTDTVGGGVWPDANGFAPVTVLQYGPGQAGGLVPDSTYVPYLYIYGSKTNNAGSQYLARVPAFPTNAIENAANWSYYTGADLSGNPLWAPSSAQAAPVWKDPNYAESLAITFNPALGRYIAYNDHGNACGGSPCERQVSLFDSPSPWGPWTTFDYEEQFDNAGCGNNCLGNQEAVGWGMMQKWFSSDGLNLWVQYSSTNAYDSLNLIKGTIGLASGSTVTNLTLSTDAAAVVDRLSLSDPGNIEFIDRTARLISIPASYLGTEVIRLARNDAPIADQNYLSFTSTVAQNVCVAWNSVIAPPPWLASWQNTGQSLVGDVTFNVYRMRVSAGTVTLPGPGSADGYLLLVGCH